MCVECVSNVLFYAVLVCCVCVCVDLCALVVSLCCVVLLHCGVCVCVCVFCVVCVYLVFVVTHITDPRLGPLFSTPRMQACTLCPNKDTLSF